MYPPQRRRTRKRDIVLQQRGPIPEGRRVEPEHVLLGGVRGDDEIAGGLAGRHHVEDAPVEVAVREPGLELVGGGLAALEGLLAADQVPAVGDDVEPLAGGAPAGAELVRLGDPGDLARDLGGEGEVAADLADDEGRLDVAEVDLDALVVGAHLGGGEDDAAVRPGARGVVREGRGEAGALRLGLVGLLRRAGGAAAADYDGDLEQRKKRSSLGTDVEVR